MSLTFTALEHGTRVRLEQTGWDELGPDGATRRERTIAGWSAVSGAYRAMLTDDEGQTRSVN
ncbi:MAG: hypothetical protein AB7V43_03775 [Acidimicrobiia bacterium]